IIITLNNQLYVTVLPHVCNTEELAVLRAKYSSEGTSLLSSSVARRVITLFSTKMSSHTDPLRLNEERLFLDLMDSLPKDIKDTRNILEIRDNVLYVWNAKEYCVMTLNVTATRGENGNVPYQNMAQPNENPIVNEFNALNVPFSSIPLARSQLHYTLVAGENPDR
ncbi:unnamed protein product, partial [Heterotrigona itama]